MGIHSGGLETLHALCEDRCGCDAGAAGARFLKHIMTERTLVAPIVVLVSITVAAALHLSAAVFAPVACALFIIAIVWPLQRSLQSRLPQLLALAVVVCAVVVVFIVFASAMAWGFGRIGRSVIADSARFQTLYDQLAEWLEGHGIIVASVWAEHFNMAGSSAYCRAQPRG